MLLIPILRRELKSVRLKFLSVVVQCTKGDHRIMVSLVKTSDLIDGHHSTDANDYQWLSFGLPDFRQQAQRTVENHRSVLILQ